MGDKTKIEWTDASWNPIRARNLKTGRVGWYCEHASEGCRFCYAEGFNGRLGTGLPFKPGHRGDVEIFLDWNILTQPLKWKRPRKIFVLSMSDLFGGFVPEEMIFQIFAVIAQASQHTFQILTKRPDRMAAFMLRQRLSGTALQNVWVGTSVEDQANADARIPHLLATPAAVRFLSCEPLLGPIDLRDFLPRDRFYNAICEHCGHAGSTEFFKEARGFDDADVVCPKCDRITLAEEIGTIGWIICGGESGRSARPMHPAWARSLRDQAAAASIPFHFKQWGEHLPGELARMGRFEPWRRFQDGDERWMIDELYKEDLPAVEFMRVGKKAAGRLLDGVTHDGFPT